MMNPIQINITGDLLITLLLVFISLLGLFIAYRQGRSNRRLDEIEYDLHMCVHALYNMDEDDGGWQDEPCPPETAPPQDPVEADTDDGWDPKWGERPEGIK